MRPRSILTLLLSIIVLSTTYSQQANSVFQISIAPGLSTNGRQDVNYSNNFSFNLTMGRSGGENGLTLAGIGNLIYGPAYGVQLAGLFNEVRDGSRGVQFSGLINRTNGFSGLQGAGMINMARNQPINGVQIAGLFNTSERMRGMQLAGFGNFAQRVEGGQAALIYNRTFHLKGIQIAGLINRTAGTMRGFQLAGWANVNEQVSRGSFMIAPVNIIHSESDAHTLGIVNLIRGGEKSIAVTYDRIGSTVVSFRSGGRILYGIIGVGFNYEAHDRLVVEYGFGAHIPICPHFRINNEIKWAHTGWIRNPAIQYEYALLPAVRIGRHVEIFAGPSINSWPPPIA